MKKGNHALNNETSKKSYKTKYIAIIVIFAVLASLVASIYIEQSSIKISSIDSKELLSSSTTTGTGKVIVKYVDTAGNEIANSTILVGNVGDEYETERKEISSYVAYGYDPTNKIGNYDSSDTEVVYVYTSESVSGSESVELSEENNVVTVTILKNKESEYDEVKFSIVTKAEDGEILYEAKYTVKDTDSETIKSAVSYGESLVVGSLIIAEEGTDTYYITEDEAPEGYDAISDTVKLSIVKTWNEETSSYDVKVVFDEYDNVEITYENGELVVTIINTETEEEPDVEEPDEEEQIFDLQIDKNVQEVQIQYGDSIITKTKDENDDVMKIDIPKSKINDTTLNITYSVEVTNIGNVAGYATEIVDIIPDGMELADDDITWAVTSDNQANTDVLKNTLIEPGDTVVIYINLVCNLSEENVGEKINQIVITEYYNEYDLEDATPSNYGEEGLVITIKTGGVWTYALLVLIILIVIAGVVMILKKNNKKENK